MSSAYGLALNRCHAECQAACGDFDLLFIRPETRLCFGPIADDGIE